MADISRTQLLEAEFGISRTAIHASRVSKAAAAQAQKEEGDT